MMTAGRGTIGTAANAIGNITEITCNSAIGKWVWRPRWSRWMTTARRSRGLACYRHKRHENDCGGPSSGRKSRRPTFGTTTAFLVLLLLLMATAIENVRALGFFELQILEIENYRGQLATGECCGGGTSTTVQQHYNKFNASSLHCAGAPQCNTLFRVCLREYQSRQPSSLSSTSMVSSSRTSDDDTTGTGSNHQQLSSTLHHCSFGNVTSPVLGANSFTLGGDTLQAATDSSSDSVNRGAAGGNLALPFSFSWTRSFTFILQAMDYNNYTGGLSVIEEATYSGILLPGNEWKALSHLGHTARMAYRVRVRCDRNYYGQTCTKLCKPRDDRFGHYTCGDTDGRKECIPGWQGENCDKAVCKTGCHPVHGKCDYPGGCECRKGWQGELCDQCMTYPGCKHGYCNGTSWQCICDVNWGGILCDQDLNYCGTHEPCLNGGTCKSTAPDRYTCTCPEGFGGTNCDVVLNPCATEPCANGGKCRTVDFVVPGGGAGNGPFSSGAQPQLLAPKQFHCDCRPGWTGSTCNTEIDECVTHTPRCLNGGTCVDLVADWKCACPDDRWRGRRCEIDVDECERHHRERQQVVIEQQQCGPNAVPCKAPGTTTVECVCRRGWMTTATRDVNNNNTASTIGCTINVDDCIGPDVKCANGGTCLDLIGGYACACPVGFTGRNCRTLIDPCGGGGESETAVGNNPCKNGGECVPAKRWRSGVSSSTKQQHQSQAYSCICPLGYSGENCEIDIDHCTPNPCRNDGQCLNTPDDYYCQCSGNGWSWHGKNCTVRADDVAFKSATATTVTTTTTVMPVTWPLPPPVSSQPPQTQWTTTVAAFRRPGVTGWRHQQQRDGEIDDTSKVTIIVEQQAATDGGVTMCTSRYRLKHWPASDGCNECKCARSTENVADDNKANGAALSCTKLWCGPPAYDCLTGVTPSCTGTNQMCMPIVDDMEEEELMDEDLEKHTGFSAATVDSLTLWRKCLRSPCVGSSGSGVGLDRDKDDVRLRYGYDDEDDTDATEEVGSDSAYLAVGPWSRNRRPGQCVTAVQEDGSQLITSVWPSVVRKCGPNVDNHRRGCGRLRVTLDSTRLRRGTRVSAVCHSLRRLLARTWIRDDEVTNDGQHREQNRVYIMCEKIASANDNDDINHGRNIKTNNKSSSHRRLRRHITIMVSVAMATNEEDDDDNVSIVVGSAVQTLYNRLGGGGVIGPTVASTKKVQTAPGHRLRPTSNNGGNDVYDDTAALVFLTAAVVNVVINSGDATLADSPSSPAPANSSGFPNNDYRQYYYYWTGGVACGALATVLATAAFLLVRFRGSTRRKVNGEHAMTVTESSAAAMISASSGVVGSGGDGLMLSLVHRQNEENLKRLVIGGNCRNSTDYGGGRNNLSAGSSLSCSRVSIVHPLCNSVAVDDDDSAQDDQCKFDSGRADTNNDKSGEKTNVAQPSSTTAPVAAVRSIAVAVAVPRQQQPQLHTQPQPQPQQQQAQPQQRTVQIAANPQPLMLCKKTLNVDNDQKHRRQQQQQQQQQQLMLLQQQQPVLHLQQQTVAQQYNREMQLHSDIRDNQQLQYHNNQQQHYATASLTHMTPIINNNNNHSDDGDDEPAPPSLTVLV